ncbi:hypothetical protein ADILRU_2302 [Leifsonia rubra CMS 76R]|nr:hypothetical protein ADILRU_2302 [Leifsonia rubra CMS 76R]
MIRMSEMTLQVEGMICTGCEQRLGIALRRLDGVRQAKANHVTGEVRVRFDGSATDEAALKERVIVAGYEVVDTKETP